MIDEIRKFLAIVTNSEKHDVDALVAALDRLAIVYQATPHDEPSTSDETPPRDDYRTVRGLVSARFPDLGVYATVDPLRLPPHEALLVGDAIDDLTDIVLDLRETLWRHDVSGVADARWHFRFSFESHWGYHLRSLQRYLHAIRFGV